MTTTRNDQAETLRAWSQGRSSDPLGGILGAPYSPAGGARAETQRAPLHGQAPLRGQESLHRRAELHGHALSHGQESIHGRTQHPGEGSPQPHARPQRRRQPVQVIAVASGKGGVGKTSLVTNLAVAFATQGNRVLALDGDLGLANLDFTFGVTARHTVLDVLNGTARIEETLLQAPGNVTLMPACHGRFELANLSEHQQYGLFSSIDTLDDRFDVLVVDTAGGIGANAVAFAAAAQQVVVVTTPEPTSLADSYSFVKVLRSRSNIKHVQVVANMVHSAAEGEMLYQRLAGLFERFLDVSSQYAGHVIYDPAVSLSIRAATPLLLHAPQAPASLCIAAVAQNLREERRGDNGGIRLFWRRLINQETSEDYFA